MAGIAEVVAVVAAGGGGGDPEDEEEAVEGELAEDDPGEDLGGAVGACGEEQVDEGHEGDDCL